MTKVRNTNRIRLSWARKGKRISFNATPIYSTSRFRPMQADFTTPKGIVSFMKRLFAEKRAYYSPSKDKMGPGKLWMRPEIKEEITKRYEGFLFRGFEQYHEPIKKSLDEEKVGPLVEWLKGQHEPEPEQKAGAIINALLEKCNLATDAIVHIKNLYEYAAKRYGNEISDKNIHLYPELVAMQNARDLGNFTQSYAMKFYLMQM